MAAASFNFERYEFTKASINMENVIDDAEVNLNFDPSGVYSKNEKLFKLTFVFTATNEGKEVVCVKSNAYFRFKDELNLEDIPDYFYPNSIAIVFPYIRAFVSNLTLLANVQPIILPTWNLSELKDELKSRTIKND